MPDSNEISVVDASFSGKGPVCDCLAELRKQMRPLNGQPGIWVSTGAALIFMRRIDPAAPAPPTVKASFCPFCGEAYR